MSYGKKEKERENREDDKYHGAETEEEIPKWTTKEHPETKSQGEQGFQGRIESNGVK